MLLNCGVGEDSWEFLDFMEINPVNPKGNLSWLFIGRTDADTPILWPPDAKNWLIGKNPDAGKDWRQEEKGTTEDEMVGLHDWLDAILGMSLGHEFDQSLGVGDGQGSLACCIPWGCKESHTTEWLNWTELIYLNFIVSKEITFLLTVEKIELLYDPAFPLLGIFQKELEAGSQRWFYMTFKAAFIHNTSNLEAT